MSQWSIPPESAAPLSDERLAEILKRTEGVGARWEYRRDDGVVAVAGDDDPETVCENVGSREFGYLIAHAPKDLRDLVAEVYRLRKELAAEREARIPDAEQWRDVIAAYKTRRAQTKEQN